MRSKYQSPLCGRYASAEMQGIFSDDTKFSTWRKLWVALAESQAALGLNINDEQIEQMKANIHNINYERASEIERETKHDVMSHIKAFGEQCPAAAPIIHLGATSCYVGDNTDIIIQKSALLLVKKLLVNAVYELYKFAAKYKDLHCLAYTHFQSAQPTTVGKRACLWIQDLLFDLEQLDFILDNLKLLGCKGTTGTAASFLALFDGDHDKVKQLEQMIAQKIGFDSNKIYPVSGQTYSRKIDYYTVSVLCGIAQSASKFSNDIRLLSHLKEIQEPFEDKQVGSSAMAYKKNPIKSERIASLARYVMTNSLNPALTASSQWFERTLDDSANRRIAIPEAFLAVDAILSLMINISGGLIVNPKIVEKRLEEELPLMATENILMHCVRKGGDRQELHEQIRLHSMEETDSDLIERILNNPAFEFTKEEMDSILNVEQFTGRSTQQCEEFLSYVKAILDNNHGLLGIDVEITI